ncbi:MAG: ubiquitin fusion degradation protein [Geoglossum umbratile]|nr:MAG: ubiquitin fusion degradation protein [Geoglossum umbratile]
MFGGNFYDNEELMHSSRHPHAGTPRRFDEFYRCYPVAMMPGPERDNVNHGGKVIMPPSALDKLTRLHITYPMLFELINSAKDRMTHAGVLEFIAEEGKIYLPFWIMQTLLLEPGDLIQIKSTDLPSGSFIKLQPQSASFLDISDPKAVLENAMRNFSALTKGDIFSFSYNDQVYEIAVLEVKPPADKQAISVLETDIEVDFAAPIGYVEPSRSGTSTPASGRGTIGALPHGGMLHNQGSMAQAINYSSIAPSSTAAAAGGKAASSNFLLGGQRLAGKKGSKASTPQGKPSTPVAGTSSNPPPSALPTVPRKTNGPQPLRLPPGKLFFGYEIKPLRNKDATSAEDQNSQAQPRFQGSGQTLRSGLKRKGDSAANSDVEEKGKSKGKGTEKKESQGYKLGGRTLK